MKKVWDYVIDLKKEEGIPIVKRGKGGGERVC